MAAGPLLLALVPVLAGRWDPVLLAVFLQLPIYVLHQVEEHWHDRFRRFVNGHLAGGREALTPRAVLVINVGFVWGFDLAALYLATFVHPALGLLAIWLALVNAAVHGVAAAVLRAYNPGLVTALLLLLPTGLWGWTVLRGAGAAPLWAHGMGILAAILVHVGIVVHVRRRVAGLGAGAA